MFHAYPAAAWAEESAHGFSASLSADEFKALFRGHPGGVAVIAHPWGRGREHVLPAELIATLAAEHQLDGIEVDHQDHDRETRRRLRALVKRLGLLGTGSSDYHGTGKTDHDLGCNTTAPEVFAEISDRLAARRS